MKAIKILDTTVYKGLCLIDVFGKVIYNPKFIERNFHDNKNKTWDLDNLDCCTQQILAIHHDLI